MEKSTKWRNSQNYVSMYFKTCSSYHKLSVFYCQLWSHPLHVSSRAGYSRQQSYTSKNHCSTGIPKNILYSSSKVLMSSLRLLATGSSLHSMRNKYTLDHSRLSERRLQIRWTRMPQQRQPKTTNQ